MTAKRYVSKVALKLFRLKRFVIFFPFVSNERKHHARKPQSQPMDARQISTRIVPIEELNGQIQNEHHFKSRVLRDKFSQKIQSQSVSTQTHADGKLRGPRNFPTTSPSAGRWVDSRQIWFYFGWTCVFFTVALHNRKNPVTGQLWPHSATSFPGVFVADAVCNSYAESGRLLATNSKWICGPRSVHIGNQSAAKKKKKQKTLKCFFDSVTQI